VTTSSTRATFEGYEVSEDGVVYRGQPVAVEPLVAGFIAFLAKSGGSVVSHEEIRAALWADQRPSDSTLYSIASRARQVLSRCSRNPIAAVRGSGYKFTASVEHHTLDEPKEVFVGRAEELTELRRLWERVVHQRRPALALVAGSPGIGKTALVRDFCAGLREQGTRCLWGRCLASSMAPAFWPWEELCGDLTVALQGSETSSRQSMTSQSTTRDLWRALRHPVLKGPELHRQWAEAVCNSLNRASQHGPLVLVIDDLHLASEEAIQLLEFVSAANRTGEVLFVATARGPTDAATDRLSQLRRHATALSLGPLGPRLSRQLLRELLGGELAREREVSIVERARGNPLFIVELARLARRLGADEFDSAALPERVGDAIDRHFSALPMVTVTALTVAAIAGQVFDVAPIALVLGCTPPQLVDSLQVAVRASVVRQVSPLSFEFAHALHRQRLRERQGADERQRTHRQLADAFVALGRSDGASLGAIATHRAAGAASIGEMRLAAEASRRAGEAYATKHAYEVAADHFRIALALGVQVDWTLQERIYVDLRLVECLWALGRRVEAQGVVEEAIELARATEDGVAFALGVIVLARLHGDLALAPHLAVLLDEALSLVDPTEASLRAQLEAWSVELLDGPRRDEALHRAMELAARSQDPVALGQAAYARVHAHWGLIDSDTRFASFVEEARLTARTTADRHLERMAMHFQICHELESGNVSRVRLIDQELTGLDETTAFPFDAYWRAVRQASLAAFTARADAMKLVDEVFDRGRTLVPVLAAEVHSAQRLLLSWETPDAAHLANQVYELAMSRKLIPSGFVVAAYSSASAGDRESARAAYLAAREVAPVHLPPGRLQIPLSFLYAELHAWFGEVESARGIYERLRVLRDRLLVTGMVTTIPGISGYSLGRVAHFLGDSKAALEHFRNARKLAERFGSEPWLRRCDIAANLVAQPYDVSGPLRPRG